MKVATAKDRLRGKQPKLNPAHEKHLVELWRGGRHTSAELAELFGVARSTIYRAVQRAGDPTPVRAAEHEWPRVRRRVQASRLPPCCRGRDPEQLDPIRKMLRGLVLPGQRRLHMNDESDPRKRSIATAVAVSGVQATIYDAGRRSHAERERRAACLQALVRDVANRGDAMFVLDQDDTLIGFDRKLLCRMIRTAGCPDLRYERHRAAAEQLLALPDVLGQRR